MNMFYTLFKKKQPAAHSSISPEERSYMEYAVALEKTLTDLEAYLHTSDDPEEILKRTLATACSFYDGDWAGFMEVDLELNLWTPYIWYKPGTNDLTATLLEEVEASDYLGRWISAMQENRAVIIEKAKSIAKEFPDEYDLYRRLRVDSVLAVPVKPRPTGFLIVRNPKRYLSHSSMLQMLAFVVLAIVNEKKLIDSTKMAWSPDAINSENDLIIKLFGELEIITSKGVLRESELKSPKISKLLTYMLLSEKKVFLPKDLAEHIWTEEAYDTENPGKNLKTLVYRLRQAFSMVSDKQLIETTPKGYRLNPDLNIMTDLKQFESFLQAANGSVANITKIDLLKDAFDLYRGHVLASAAGEHWLLPIASRYNLQYIGVVNELLKTLFRCEDYAGVHKYAVKSLEIESANMRAYFWLIRALWLQGAGEMAKAQMLAAEQNLDERSYGELIAQLEELQRLNPGATAMYLEP